ncbi:hypothetical protein [Acinetobacter courvalinii]|uniref:hypothetical protein n=1 Tax=Acinetobacter courvalinii TaxID=280147 RepID=UPI0021D0A21F|nr:hypothetical protein [Acinetobacter courvalinii]MCU4640912.1 hypothetical protein [Acinetobacter courvalinii]
MNSKILSLIPFTVLVFFSACGDEKPKGNSKVENNEPLKCIPSYEKWLELERGNSVAETESKLNCKGYKRSERVNLDYTKKINSTSSYEWLSDAKTPLISINYNGEGKLQSKTYFFPSGRKKSSCFPSKDVIEDILSGAYYKKPLEEVEKAIGCVGQWQQSSVSYATFDNYNWEDPSSKKNLSLLFFEGKFTRYDEEKSNFFKDESNETGCIPTYSAWESVNVHGKFGDTYGAAIKKLGCSSDQNQYSWGRSDGSTDFVQISLGPTYGLVISKQFLPKLGSNDACTPLYENWNSIPLGAKYREAKNIMGCEGTHTGVVTYDYGMSDEDPEIEINFYKWRYFNISKTSRPVGVENSLTFENLKLTQKTYNNSVSPFSSCNPTQQNFDSVKIGEVVDIKAIDDIWGCGGTIEEAKADQVSFSKIYAWGDAESAEGVINNYATVKLDQNNKVVEKYIYFRP